MEPLNVVQTTFYVKENAKEHHTDQFDLVKADNPTPIFRRGGNIYMAIMFDREYDVETDVVRVRFGFGPKPNVIRGTRAVLAVRPKQKRFPDDPFQWGILLSRNDGNNSIVIEIRIPPNTQIGIWECSIQTNIAKKRESRHDYKIPEDIYVLFNPWCPDDGVYMENEEDRNEYVLNETGKIWCGTFKEPKGKHWIFGQFNDISLPGAVFLLEKSGLAPADRGSPVMVARAISAIINAVDEGGLLEGRWDGDYADGTSPHSWTGSAAIMDQYLRSGGTPVKYGQCWVYSAATVTVCRALGIPCRSTTNYVSAHDTNQSLTVDKYFDIFGNRIENGPEGDCTDSCWNFHVWNDVWMTRPDLPPGYGGWQIIDATPQEQSERVMRCGPASVAAVKKGEIGFLYDTPFVFSEVNADVVHFKEDEESDWGFTRLNINQYHVGRKLLTKKVGPTDDKAENDLWDVTLVYKNKEGTEAERLAVYNAVRGVPRAQALYEIPNKENEDVFFDLIDIDSIPFGQSFSVVVRIHNKAKENRTISAVLSASSVYYTGRAANDIKKSQGTFNIKPGNKETLQIHVTPEEYLEKLVDHGLIKIYAIATVKDTKQTWSEEDDFTLKKPDMQLTAPQSCVVGGIIFKNPLSIPLTECLYTVEGPGLHKPKTIRFRDVTPEEEVNIIETFVAKRTGDRRIVASFTSKQIQDLNASTSIKII
ncbi:hypothetical protein NQ317_018935 [Molorchus minor]|uniref:Transglutaminase-like domain-containing protein n=1 Tax=Molorchus minor TaxID=1323400 RepID=A0ABQ9JB67_9CUCU|nr:hypothetical protein NQ317_018935 [Molorchus minor]